MIKAIKDSKWYWWIPVVYFIFLLDICKWTLEPDLIQERANRSLLSEILMLPSFITTIIIIWIIKVLI